jgi:hypothetical protein
LSKYLALSAIVLVVGAISGAYFIGKGDGKQVCEMGNLKADQAQADESREIKNAIEKLDDTGLRDTILGVQPNR